jgi:hypothetical protein
MQSEVDALGPLHTAVLNAADPIERTWTIEPVLAPGIPDPSGNWGALDPLTAQRPAWPGGWPSAEVANYYYIDANHGQATDTANDYGYPDKPRLTIPETTYAAGSYVEIHDGPYRGFGGNLRLDFVSAGTEANPVWVVGPSAANMPLLEGDLRFRGSYLFIENIKVGYDAVNTREPSVVLGDSTQSANHIVFRDSVIEGDDTFHSGFDSAITADGATGDECTNLVVYNVTASKLNDTQYAIDTAEDDNTAISPVDYVEDFWVIACDFYDYAGDGCQIGSNNLTGEERVERFYVSNCHMWSGGENAIDIKSSVDVIISGCKFWDFENSQGSDGTAVVVQQEGGQGSDNVWILFTEIYDTVIGVRAEEAVTNVYCVGCIVRDTIAYPPDATYGWAYYTRTDEASLSVIDSLAADLDRSGIGWNGQSGMSPTIDFHGNILANKGDAAAWFLEGDSTTIQGAGSDYNLFDSADQFRVDWEGTEYTTLASYQAGESEDGNSLSAVPLFEDQAVNDFRS